MTGDRKFFLTFDGTVKEEVYLVDGSVIETAGVGEGFLNCVEGEGKLNKRTEKEVLYIPELKSKLDFGSESGTEGTESEL